ncbi:291_t:CDS:1 [Cetraspora pellucida]|uniref:291_t:CDS:1 n=1 Tax=Cetraspora pellucida TaxID=1433469 RepID=A0A9N9ASJ9_9GLOM|nr:291_t:CDS:1 [Cetraspora pellucida]
MSSKNNDGFAIIQENPCPSQNSLQKEIDALFAVVYDLLKTLPIDLKLSVEEILAPREQNTEKQPRPQNRFILYRKAYIAHAKEEDPDRTRSMSIDEISKEAAQNWETLPRQAKQFFTILAEIADKRHKQLYPDYIYRPQKKETNEEFGEYIDYSECS